MPRKYTKITPQIIEKVKKYLADDRGFSKTEVARLVGISDHSVQRIVQGYYDQPVENTETQVADLNQDSKARNITEIPYEQLEYLIKCECFVSEMFSIAIASDKNEDELYFPRHYIDSMCDRYFPERKAQKLRELNSL